MSNYPGSGQLRCGQRRQSPLLDWSRERGDRLTWATLVRHSQQHPFLQLPWTMKMMTEPCYRHCRRYAWQARPDGPPPDFEGTVATGISTLAADRTFLPNSQVLLNKPIPQATLNQPVPQSTLMEEAREYKIFLSNSEIAMQTAAGEEDKLCWGGCYKFFPEDTDGRQTYAACPFR